MKTVEEAIEVIDEERIRLKTEKLKIDKEETDRLRYKLSAEHSRQTMTR